MGCRQECQESPPGNNRNRPLFLMRNFCQRCIFCLLTFKKWHGFCCTKICRFGVPRPPPPSGISSQAGRCKHSMPCCSARWQQKGLWGYSPCWWEGCEGAKCDATVKTLNEFPWIPLCSAASGCMEAMCCWGTFWAVKEGEPPPSPKSKIRLVQDTDRAMKPDATVLLMTLHRH